MKPIIIAEDYKDIRRIYVNIIKELSEAEIDEAGNGKELVEKVKQGDYSLVITDNSMPLMNGLEAITEIRKFNSSVPICMICADDIESEAIESGATDYIAKPVERSKLKALIKKYK